MSSPEESADARSPLLSHVHALFASLKLLLVSIGIAAAIGYLGSEYVVAWLSEPFQSVMGDAAKLVYLSPFEKVWVHLRVAFWSGTIVMAPVHLGVLYRFVAPAFAPSQRRTLVTMCLSLWAAFWVGVFFAHAYSIPLLLKALMGFKGLNETPFLALAPYVDMALGAVLSTALLFQLPVVMFFVTFLGWVPKRRWQESRRGAIVLNACASAILSPPDALSMIVLMIPIQLLYEAGILASGVAEHFHRSKTAKIKQ